MQLCVAQVFCDLGLIMVEQEWTEAGVSSSDLTQLTSRLVTPRNVKETFRPDRYIPWQGGVGYRLSPHEKVADRCSWEN